MRLLGEQLLRRFGKGTLVQPFTAPLVVDALAVVVELAHEPKFRVFLGSNEMCESSICQALTS